MMLQTTQIKNFSFSEFSHQGNVRENNEDYLGNADTINGYVFVVCDGVGGGNAGEVASQFVVNYILEFLNEKWYESAQQALEEALEFSNLSLLAKSQESNNYRGMATTVVALLIRDEKVFYAHAGDSRIYYFTSKKYFQLTKDHSFVQELIDKEKLSKKEAKNHPRRNEITKAVGVLRKLTPSVSKESIKPETNNYILLCTDGLYSEISDKVIFKTIFENINKKNIAEILANKALTNGGNDNITLQLIHFYKSENIIENPITDKKKRHFLWKIAYFIVPFFIISLFLWIGISETNFIPKKYLIKKSFSSITLYSSENKLNIKDSLQYYYTKPGDEIWLIGKLFHVSVEEIIILNNKKTFYFIPGERIIIAKRKKLKVEKIKLK